MTDFFRNKKILVTGGTGTIGPILVQKLLELGADITVVSIDSESRVRALLDPRVKFKYANLMNMDTCLKVTAGMDHVFHLAGIKGNTQIGLSKTATIFVTFVLCNTNMMEASFRQGVKRFLYMGSICQYPSLAVRHEDDVWSGPPAANDRHAGIAKRAGEAQAEAYLSEHGWDAVRIVRLSNVYGPYDDFDSKTGQVIPALIRRAMDGENPLHVAGDGSAIRDFIYSEDVVDGILLAMENAPPCFPINLGSGKDCTIREVAETIAAYIPGKPSIVWDSLRPTGDQKRVLSVDRAREVLGFSPRTSLSEGIRKTIDWYQKNTEIAKNKCQPSPEKKGEVL